MWRKGQRDLLLEAEIRRLSRSERVRRGGRGGTVFWAGEHQVRKVGWGEGFALGIAERELTALPRTPFPVMLRSWR